MPKLSKYIPDPENPGKFILRPTRRKPRSGNKPADAEAKAARQAQMDANRATRIFLYMPHHRKENTYGPGWVVVNASLANELQGEEQRAREQEAAFYGTKGGIILGRDPRRPNQGFMTKQVPVESFDLALGDDSNLADSISGKQ